MKAEHTKMRHVNSLCRNGIMDRHSQMLKKYTKPETVTATERKKKTQHTVQGYKWHCKFAMQKLIKSWYCCLMPLSFQRSKFWFWFWGFDSFFLVRFGFSTCKIMSMHILIVYNTRMFVSISAHWWYTLNVWNTIHFE